MTCSEDFTIAISSASPGATVRRGHQWGPAGRKYVQAPNSTKVFARWPNGRYPLCFPCCYCSFDWRRYYHGTVDHQVEGIGGGGMCSVKFRGWHGPDSRATYEPIALFPDSSNCTCKKGHSALDIPCVSLVSCSELLALT